MTNRDQKSWRIFLLIEKLPDVSCPARQGSVHGAVWGQASNDDYFDFANVPVLLRALLPVFRGVDALHSHVLVVDGVEGGQPARVQTSLHPEKKKNIICKCVSQLLLQTKSTRCAGSQTGPTFLKLQLHYLNGVVSKEISLESTDCCKITQTNLQHVSEIRTST